jgi:hypothetical protein
LSISIEVAFKADLRAAATTTESPEKLGVAALRSLLELAVRGDNLVLDDIIDLKTELVGERVVSGSLGPASSNANALASFRQVEKWEY